MKSSRKIKILTLILFLEQHDSQAFLYCDTRSTVNMTDASVLGGWDNVASRPTCTASLTFTHNPGNTVYFPAAICFMRFRALPALNHSICCSFIVWFKEILSTFPSECLISAFTGCNIKNTVLLFT